MNSISEIKEEIKKHKAQLHALLIVLRDLQTTLETALNNRDATWIAAVGSRKPHSKRKNRLILNLAALSSSAKKLLRIALADNMSWISFKEDGDVGSSTDGSSALAFYEDIKIIFGAGNEND